MEALLKFLADNVIIICVFAAAIIALVIVFVSISAKNARKKRDAEYAKMFEEVPIENDSREDISFGEGQNPEFEKTEMDWLKGEQGYFGVIRTTLPPLKTEPKETKIETNPETEVKNEETTAEGELKPETENPKKNGKVQKAAKQKKNNIKEHKIFLGTKSEQKAETEQKPETELKAEDKSETEQNGEETKNKQEIVATETEIRQLKIDDIAEENAATNAEENVATNAEEKEDEEMAEKKAENKTEKKAGKANAKFAEKLAVKALEKASATSKTPAKKTVGKWVIKEKGEGEFVAYLYANNKELMLTSETYSTPDGARKGIGTIQKNAASDENFTYYRDKKKNYYFKLKTSQNRFLCVGETYPNKSACLKSIESVKNFVDSPVSDAIEKDITIIKYVPTQGQDFQTKKYSGKWVITPIDDEFMAQLRASNGELLLSSESYSSYASAKDAIDNITQNAEAGNFIIDSDKKGRYFFKLRNDRKLTLCIGETYSQLSACQSAIESVRGFLKTAKLAEKQ